MEPPHRSKNALTFFALLLDGASLDAGLFALLQRQRPGAGVGLGVTLCPGSLGVPALRVYAAKQTNEYVVSVCPEEQQQ